MQIRTPAQGIAHWHCRSNSELACFITGRGNHATGIAANDDRSAAKLGIIPLLNRCVERIHIHVQDMTFFCHRMRSTI